MRISELSRLSDVPTATIKYYLREGLLPAGRRTAATQAQYDRTHVQRLRLIRALVGPGRLSIAEVRGVLAAVDGPPTSAFELLGQASEALGPAPKRSEQGRAGEPGDTSADEEDIGSDDEEGMASTDEEGMAQARQVIHGLGWQVAEESKAFAQLAAALAAIDQAEIALIPGGVEGYARTLHDVAVAELYTVPLDSPQTAVRQAVLGTILIEPLLIALRRLALQDAAARRFGTGDAPIP